MIHIADFVKVNPPWADVNNDSLKMSYMLRKMSDGSIFYIRMSLTYDTDVTNITAPIKFNGGVDVDFMTGNDLFKNRIGIADCLKIGMFPDDESHFHYDDTITKHNQIAADIDKVIKIVNLGTEKEPKEVFREVLQNTIPSEIVLDIESNPFKYENYESADFAQGRWKINSYANIIRTYSKMLIG